MLSVLVLEFPGRPPLARTTNPTIWDNFCPGTAGNYIGPPGPAGPAGDGGGRQNVVRPGPWLLLVGQVQEKTGRDDEMSSVLVLAQDGRTAPLRTLPRAVAVT